MAEIAIDPLVQLVGSLGTFGVVIWLYIQSQKTLKEKDEQIKELNNKVLTAFELNATTNQSLNDTIKQNTIATQSLTERVTDVLINRNRN